jgi:ABC-type Fe3+-hydroxamate transport system substrate-binding protein
MSNDTDTGSGRTRREYLAYSGTITVEGLLAGCLGADRSGSAGTQSTASATPTATETADPTTEEPASYAASIEPVGAVTFEEPPERVVGGWGFVCDVLMGLGRADSVVGMARPGFWYQGFNELLPGVRPRDTAEIPATVSKSYRVQEELLYELDPDLLATDPDRFVAWYGLESDAVARLRDDVAPFFGNESRSKRSPSWPNWVVDGPYRYHSIPEFVERYGQAFQEQARASALIDLYETTL